MGHPERQLGTRALHGETWEPWWGAAEASYQHEMVSSPWAWTPHLPLWLTAGSPFLFRSRSCLCRGTWWEVPHILRSSRCRCLVIRDHSHRIQVTLIQAHFQPYPDLCVALLGGCLLLIFLESQRIFVGREEGRREGASEHAGSQRSTWGWCLQSKNALPLYSCLMWKTEGPGRWYLTRGSCLWGVRSHRQITVMPFALLSKNWVDWNRFSRREQRHPSSLLSRVNKYSSWYKDEQLNRVKIMTFPFTSINTIIPEGIINLALNSCSSS